MLISIFIVASITAPVEIDVKDAVNLAVKNNPSVKIKYLNLQKAEAKLMEAKMNLYVPNLSFSGTYTRLDPDSVDRGTMKIVSFQETPMGPIPQTKEVQVVFADNWSFKFSLAKPIFTGFALSTAVDMAETQLELARRDLELTKREVEYQVKSAFYQYLVAKEFLKISKETQRELEEHLNYSKAAFEAGKVSEYDLLRSQTQVEANKPSIESSKKNLKILEQRLKTLLGIPLEENVKFVGDVELPKYKTLTLKQAQKLALENSPDIVKLKTSLKLAKLSVKMAKSEKYPSVSIFGSYGWDYKKENNYSEEDRKFVGSGSVGVQIQIPLSSLIPGNAPDQKIKQAEISLKTSEENLKLLSEQIKLQVESLLLSLKEAELNTKSQKLALELAQKGLEMARERYRTGRMSNIDLIDAELSWTRAKVSYLQAVFQLRDSLMKLEKITGTKLIKED